MNPTEPPRKEGESARQRLLMTGLRLFAERGFAKTSTRELAEAAGVNIAAISYYFGDKAGLYRAVFVEPQAARVPPQALNDPALSLAQSLALFYAGFLEPLREGDVARLCIKLHFREMLEPTGLWAEEIAGDIRPLHEALMALLCRHFGVAKADDDLLRLAVCLEALGVHQHVGRDVTDQLAPGLYDGPEAIDRWSERLVHFALAMIEAEQARRRQAAPETAR